jgi:hypothetical protein
MTVADDEFLSVSRGLRRWSERSLAAAREMLVENKSAAEVAATHGMTAEQARAVSSRFLSRLRQQRVVKVSAAEYLNGKVTLNLLRPELEKLRRAGLGDSDLIDYLAKNDITVTVEQLKLLLDPPTKGAKRNENSHDRQPKRRRR